jgi:hypothetical protein
MNHYFRLQPKTKFLPISADIYWTLLTPVFVCTGVGRAWGKPRIQHSLGFLKQIILKIKNIPHISSSLRHYATSRNVAGSSPDEVDFFNLPNPSSRTMTLGSTQRLTEMSIRNLPGGKYRPARKTDELTAICEPIV